MTTDRPAVLRSLPRFGFVPPPDAAAVPPDEGAAFAAAVADFASSYWALPPAERRARWQALADRPVGHAAARLAELKPGLAVAPVTQADPLAAELSKLVRELFVLPPTARAARRLAWVTAPEHKAARWTEAARVLLRNDMPLARLEERLLDGLSLQEVPAPVAAVAESAARVRRREPVYAPVPAAAAPAAGGCGCLSGPAGLVFAGIVILRLIIAGAGGTRSTTPSYSPPPAYTAPDATAPVGGPFTHSEVLQFFTYEDRKRQEKLEPGERAPRRYNQWVDQGRPGWVHQP